MNDRWLQSDGKILGKVRKAPCDNGVRVELDMPDGEVFVAELERLSADSAAQFCELARGEWDARKASKEAAQVSGSRKAERAKDQPEARVPSYETDVAVSILDPASVAARCDELSDRIRSLGVTINGYERERIVLWKVLEVLDEDAQSNDAQKLRDVPEVQESGSSEGLDSPSRSHFLPRGQADPVSDGKEKVPYAALELPTPNTDTEGGSVDHQDHPAVPVGGGLKDLKPLKNRRGKRGKD